MGRLLAIVLFLSPLLAACSLAPAVNQDVLDYFKANDLATNRVILLNILLAKERAPLHFSELADIHGSLSLSLTSTTVEPFGPVSQPPGLASGTETPAFTISSSPTFDVNSLDTQDFVGAMIQPISAGTAEFFLDEGLDSRMVLMLLAQGILLPGQKEMFLNAPDSKRQVCYSLTASSKNSPAVQSDFLFLPTGTKCAKGKIAEAEYFGFLDNLDKVGAVYPVSISLPGQTIGVPVRLDSAKYLAAVEKLDSSKFRLKPITAGKYRGMYQLTTPPQDVVVLCGANNADPDVYDPSSGTPDSVEGLLTDDDPSTQEVPANSCDPAADPSAKVKSVNIGADPGTFVIKLRSTEELVSYVGRVLALQDRMSQVDGMPECITLQYQHRSGSPPPPPPAHTCDGGGALFDLKTAPDANTSDITLWFDGQTYYVPAAAPEYVDEQPAQTAALQVGAAHYDHSLETMAIISLLVNQNKSTKDISKTANVQLVP